jgi:methylated-DNA-[protein]-cysteine S-methyltransferase
MVPNQPVRCVFFTTPIGACALAFGEQGILALQLPEADDARTRARLLRTCLRTVSGGAPSSPDEPAGRTPPQIERVIEDIAALLNGQPRGLEHAQLDMRALPAFEQRVYQVTRAIAPGRTLSYGEVASRCGEPQAARAVGQALGRNPFPIIVPCHRVLAAGGKSGGFSARGGLKTKLQLLSLEGAWCALPRRQPTDEQPNLALPL